MVDFLEQFAGVEMQLGAGFFAYFFEFSDTCYPNTEELIEVGRVDGQKLEALQQWYCRVFGFLKNPVIKREPGDVAVSIRQRLQWVGY